MSETVHFTNSVLPQLSNFYVQRTPITYEGKTYASSEHLYQARKFLGQPDRASIEFAEEIRRASTPFKAKHLANLWRTTKYEWQKALSATVQRYVTRGVVLRDDWDAVKVAIMREVLTAKFSGDAECRSVLLATGNATLVERTDTDAFWGDGRDRGGRNELGRLLMAVREELRQSASHELK